MSEFFKSYAGGYQFGFESGRAVYEFGRQKKADAAREQYVMAQNPQDQQQAAKMWQAMDPGGFQEYHESQQTIMQNAAKERRATEKHTRDGQKHDASMAKSEADLLKQYAPALSAVTDEALQLGESERGQFFQERLPAIAEKLPFLGPALEEAMADGIFTDDELTQLKDGLKGYLPTDAGKFSKGTPTLIKQEGGFAFATPTMDNRTGATDVSVTPFDGVPVDRRTGDTADEGSTRKVQDAGDIEAAKQGAKIDAIADKDEAQYHSGVIADGLTTADTVPILTRSLEVLEDVQTGGFSGAAIKAKQMLGIEAADEGELSYLLTKQVLQQLRPTFGSQFTAAEGRWLERVEPTVGKSVAANRQILQQAIRRAQAVVDRAIESAHIQGRTEEAERLEEMLNFDLSGGDEPLSDEEMAELEMLRSEGLE